VPMGILLAAQITNSYPTESQEITQWSPRGILKSTAAPEPARWKHF
jgi:hypothetical protein